MSARIEWSEVWGGFLIGVLLAFVGAVGGGVLGLGAYNEWKWEAAEQKRLRDLCVGGNANACRLVELAHR